MARPPFSKDLESNQYLLRGASIAWLFLCAFCYLVGLAISLASAESVVLGMIALVVLIMLMTSYSDAQEFKTLLKHIAWYRIYSILTLFSGAITSFIASTDSLGLVLLVLLIPNGMFIWPFVTVRLYKKNYTKLFGLFDA